MEFLTNASEISVSAQNRDKGLRRAIKAAGGLRALARKLGITSSSLTQWTSVPYDRIVQVEQVTGVPREELRPELYRKPPKK